MEQGLSDKTLMYQMKNERDALAEGYILMVQLARAINSSTSSSQERIEAEEKLRYAWYPAREQLRRVVPELCGKYKDM